ncbi:hypothetical protein DFP73DRAFT_144558, partial [Morchella snyderi]
IKTRQNSSFFLSLSHHSSVLHSCSKINQSFFSSSHIRFRKTTLVQRFEFKSSPFFQKKKQLKVEMKSVFVFAIAGLVASVSAQSLSDLPSCALSCLTTGLAATDCSITDFKCACSNTAFVSGSATCIQDACPEADRQKALAAAGALCASAGVTIPTTFPASGSTPATSAASSSAAVSSSVAATTTATAIASTTATTTAVVSSSAAPVSSGTIESFPTVIASGSSTLTTSAVPSASATGDLTSSASVPVQTTNAANRLGGMSGLAVAGLGLVGYMAL